MSFLSQIASVASTDARTDFSVVESPAMGINQAHSLSRSVSNSPDVYPLDSKKRNMIEPSHHEMEMPSAKRACLWTHETQFSLASSSELSIFDSDGLISFPDPEPQAAGVNETSAPKQQVSVETGSLQLDQAPLSVPQLESFVAAQSSPTIASHPQISEGARLSEAMSNCSSPGSGSPPRSSVDASDASLLQLTVTGMIACLRRVSDIAVANPQLAESTDVYRQIAAANQIVADVVHNMASAATSPIPSIQTPPAPVAFFHEMNVPVPEPAPVLPAYELRVSEMETLWYADRPYPAVEVELVDGTTGQRATDVSDRRIQVSLVDGSGAPCDKLSGHASSFGFAFPVINGVAEISGIRFSAVSSKFGGHFQLRMELVPEFDKAPVEPFVSPRLQVLSYRLFHAPKVDFSKLRPSDPLSKVKGIGSLYAKRFAAIGVETVAQLAELEVDSLSSGDEHSLKLLECLRRDRGALTVTKLAEYISQARDIVRRQSEFAFTSGGSIAVPRM